MKVLAVTNLFPNARQPNRGVFNLQQFEALHRFCELHVVAPLPWQPWVYGLPRAVPYEEEWCGLRTLHPFYIYTPGVGRAAYSLWLYAALRRVLAATIRAYRPDVLLGTWAYPDAVATALVARDLKLPWVAQVLGSDINVLTKNPGVRAQVRWALSRASRVVAVSHALQRSLVGLGIRADAVRVQHNGVHVDRFYPLDRREARLGLGLSLDRRILLYVGNLEPIKGVMDLIEAARILARQAAEPPLICLVGGGRLKSAIDERVRKEGLGDSVRMMGPRPHTEIARWLGAADALCLPSHQEGCPNVVLEALACGRPVVGTTVGAVPDLIDERVGETAPPRQPAALAEAIRVALSRNWDATAIRERVLSLSWEGNARALAADLRRAVGGGDREVTSAGRSPW